MTGILGVVLAGGASSRFGSDKALATIGGERLLDLAVASLRSVADEVVVIGRAGGIADRPAPGLGPLGGIAGALDYADTRGFASVLTIGCDMPGLPPALLATLAADMPRYCRDAPVLGHWPVALAADLTNRLARVGVLRGAALSVRRWADAIGAVPIPAPAPLFNVNTPADLPPS